MKLLSMWKKIKYGFGIIATVVGIFGLPSNVLLWFQILRPIGDWILSLGTDQYVALAIAAAIWGSLLPWRRWFGRDWQPLSWSELLPREDYVLTFIRTVCDHGRQLAESDGNAFASYVEHATKVAVPEILRQSFGNEVRNDYLKSIRASEKHAKDNGYEPTTKAHIVLEAAQNYAGSLLFKAVASRVEPQPEVAEEDASKEN